MRLTWKDGIATLLVAGVVTLYAAFSAGAAVPLFGSARMIAGAALVLGLGACIAGGDVAPTDAPGGTQTTPRDRWMAIMGVFGLGAFVSGLIVLIAANEVALAVLIGLVAAMWLATTVRHALRKAPRPKVHAPQPRVERKPPVPVG